MIYTNNLQSNCETMKHTITTEMTLILHASRVKLTKRRCYLTFRVRMVGTKQRGQKIVERKLILWVFGWREGKNGKLVGLMCFFPLPTKIISLQFWKENKGERNSCRQWLNYPLPLLHGPVGCPFFFFFFLAMNFFPFLFPRM